MNGPRADFERRMHRVLAHVDAHLAGTLDLATLAAVANFSPFHFHRLFAAWTGETLADYVRRRRVETAAVQLLAQPRLSVLNAALGVGFGSAEAFTRAFRARFGAAPTVWRAAERKGDQADRKIGQAGRPAPADDGGTMNEPPPADVRLLELAPVRIAYLRQLGAYGAPLQRFWARSVAPWLVLHGRTGRITYGISRDDPGVTRAAACRYDAGVALADGETPGRDELVAELPGGRYAVLRYDGPIERIGDGWTQLLRDWLPGTGLQLDARPCFERYPPDGGFDAGSGRLRCEICVPVAPL